MTAANRNIVIEAGSTWNDVITWKTGTPAAAVNLSGYTARMQIRATRTAATSIIDITPTLGGAAGTITCTLTAVQTAALDFTGAPEGYVVTTDSLGVATTTTGKCAVYDLELINGATVTRLAQGIVCLSPEVTR